MCTSSSASLSVWASSRCTSGHRASSHCERDDRDAEHLHLKQLPRLSSTWDVPKAATRLAAGGARPRLLARRTAGARPFSASMASR
eukprot:513327-Pyramimonas_sp.AAC.1